MNRYFGSHMLEGEWHALLPRYLLLSERVDGARVLDVGCGSGIGASLLLDLGAEMVDAIDHRPAVLELARMKHAKQGLDFHVMFWEELDFPDDTFDVVTCLDPSSPVTDPSLLQEVRRVLKPGGEYVCAIERSPLSGLEVLLPRYGYADAAENIDIHSSETRPPQVGELQNVFAVSRSVIQRPCLSYIFDSDVPRDPGDETTRKSHQDGQSGLWEQEAAGDGRWITVDSNLQKTDDHLAAVELWFCGDEAAPPPPLREIRLPYFSLVERLHQVFNELQMRQVRGGDEDESVFDEIVDNAAEADPGDGGRDRETTNEYRVVNLEDAETGPRNDLTEENTPTMERVEVGPTGDAPIESQLQELSALYHQVRQEFQTVVRDAQNALEERDRYIEHLVGKVEEWQTRYHEEAGSSDAVDDSDLDEHTSVFDGSESKSEDDSTPGEAEQATSDASKPADEEADSEASAEPSDAAEPADSDAETDERSDATEDEDEPDGLAGDDSDTDDRESADPLDDDVVADSEEE